MSKEPTRAGAVGGEHSSAGGRLVSVDGRLLPLWSVGLRGDASGGLARIVLEQRFENPYPDPLRVTYQVPLPPEAAVSGYAFQIGGRRVVGEVDRLEAARERFEQALVEGQTAGLLEQDRSSLFTQEIGNIPPGTEVVAELVIDQRLRWLEEGAWEWRFPTVVASRYLGAAGRVPDAERVTVDVADKPLAVGASLALTVRDSLTGGLSAGSLPASPSHVIGTRAVTGGTEVTLADDRRNTLDRDVVIRWRAAQTGLAVLLETGRPAADRPHAGTAYGLLTLTPPRSDEQQPALPRDLIVLVDMSGSMAGKPLEQARRVVARLIDTLGDADQIELIGFANEAKRWKPRPVRATAAAKQQAMRWLERLSAGGGTEMRSGVAEALQPLRPEAQRQVVLITDGEIGFESEIVGLIMRDLPAGCRLHTVGVGPAVNRTLTSGAARAGRGAEIVVGLDEDPEPPIARLVARLAAPLLTELALSGPALLDHVPARLPDLHGAAPVLISLRLKPAGGAMRITGRLGGKSWEEQVRVTAVPPGVGNTAVLTLYAREAVEDLEMRRAAGETAAIDEQIERLGLQFQVATRLTSWVAVSEEPTVDPGQPTRRERIPQTLPEGLSVEGLGLRGQTVWADQSFALRSIALRQSFIPLLQRHFEPAAVPPVGLRGRIVLRRDRDLVIEIELDRALDWDPSRARVVWADGTEVRAVVDTAGTTHAGTFDAGQVIRVVLCLATEGLATPPARVLLHSGDTSIVVRLEP